MARDHARLLHRVWTDPQFLSRTERAQRTYMVVLSQPTLTLGGVAPYTVRRWTRLAADSTDAGIRAGVEELAAANFLVVDSDTEEVFIRSYVRNDNVLSNPNVAIAAVRAYDQIASPRIRRAWLVELHRLYEESKTAATPEKAWTDPRSSKVLAEVLSKPLPDILEPLPGRGTEGGPEPLPEPLPTPPSDPLPEALAEPPHEPLPEGVSDDPPEGGPQRGTGRGTEGGPPTRAPATRAPATRARDARAAPSPSPSPHSVGGAASQRPPGSTTTTVDDKPSTAEANAGPIVAAYIDGATEANRPRPAGTLVARVGRQARQLLAEGIPAAALIAAAHRMGTTGWHDLAVQLQRDANPPRAAPPRNTHTPYMNPTNQDVYDRPI